MRRIILTRHGAHGELGKILSGRSDMPLNAMGASQADALASALAQVPLTSLYTSPQRRARETIAPLAARRHMVAQVTPALDEIDFGDFTGRSFAALASDPDWFEWNARRDVARCPGGETMAEAIDRTLVFLKGLPASACPALCVTHCDIIRGVVAAQLGLGYDRIFMFDCDPASCTTFDLSDQGMRLVALNERVRL